MRVTSKEANKILKDLERERSLLLLNEQQSSTFLSAVGENVESNRPQYDYEDTQIKIKLIESKILKVKHAINKFNVETIVDGFDITIDQMLVYIPQLNECIRKLNNMQSKLPKERVSLSSRSNIIDYTYINYNTDEVSKDYKICLNELNNAQLALDTINVEKTFEIDI